MEFYLDVTRKEILANLKKDRLGERNKPPFYRDLDHHSEDQDSMMVCHNPSRLALNLPV
jgi:hypothetical protein